MNDDQQLELLRYLNGEASAEEASALEARASADRELASELRAWQETFAAVAADGVAPIEPSAPARRALLDRIASSSSATTNAGGTVGDRAPVASEKRTEKRAVLDFPSSHTRSLGTSGWLAAAACLLAAIAIGRGFWVEQRLRDEVDRVVTDRQRLEDSLLALGQRLTGTQSDVEQLALILQTSSSPRTRSVVLAGLEDAPNAFGTTLVRPGEAAFFAYSLPPLTPEQEYQLWFIGDDGPVSGGTFAVDDRGSARVLVSAENLDRASQWAVTIEPRGGVPQPTGAMVLLGSVSA